MKAIVTGSTGPVRHAYPTGAIVTILKQDGNKTDFWCRDPEGLKQWVCGIDMKKLIDNEKMGRITGVY